MVMTTQACEVYGENKTQNTNLPWVVGVLGMPECMRIAESIDGGTVAGVR